MSISVTSTDRLNALRISKEGAGVSLYVMATKFSSDYGKSLMMKLNIKQAKDVAREIYKIADDMEKGERSTELFRDKAIELLETVLNGSKSATEEDINGMAKLLGRISKSPRKPQPPI